MHKNPFPIWDPYVNKARSLISFLSIFKNLSMFVPLHHLLPLWLKLLFSFILPLPSPSPHQSLFCSAISKAATVFSLSSSGLLLLLSPQCTGVPSRKPLKVMFYYNFHQTDLPRSLPLQQLTIYDQPIK